MKTILYISACIIFLYDTTFGQAGTLDPSFGGDGIVYTVLGNFFYSIDAPQSIKVLPDGKILVAESNISADNGDSYGLVQYNSNGSLDTAFGAGGSVLTESANGNLTSMVVQPDGKIVVAGNKNSDNQVFQLIRYLPDGSLDPSFGSGGIVLADIGNYADPRSLALQADGKIVAAGLSYNGANNDVTVARYNQDGTLDVTFGNSGVVMTDIANHNDYAQAVAIQTDGKIVVAAMYNNGVTNNFPLIRYKNNGSPDASFDNDGIVSDDSIYVTSMLIQPDGKIVIAGSSFGDDFCLVRYHPDGNHDNTFGANGKVITDMGGDDIAASVVRQPDGKLIAVGTNSSGVANTVLARYLPDGMLDTSYGTGGKVNTFLGGENYGLCAALQPDGKLVAGALSVFDYEDGEMAIIRYLGDNVPECPIPGGLFIAESLPTVVKMEWDDVGFAIGYRLRYKIKGSDTWIPKNSVFHSKIITGLEPNTEYVWQVKSICSLSPLESSDWSEKQHFMTPLRLTEETILTTPLFIFPNPFSDNANVQFFVEKSEYLKIELRDLQGKKIKTIAEGNFSEGDHQLLLQKENLRTGAYFLKLTSNSAVSIQKVLIE